MRVVEEPFTSRDAIVGVSRLGRTPTEGAFRTLRTKRLVSPGLYVEPRGVRGRLLGRTSFYSSLNVDAARAVRLGHEGLAKRLAARAEEIENSTDSFAVRDALQEAADRYGAAPDEDSAGSALSLAIDGRRSRRASTSQTRPRDWLIRSDAWMTDENRNQLTAAVAKLDAAAAGARRELLGQDDMSATTFFGVVRRLDPTEAEVESSDEVRGVARDELERVRLAAIGTPVALLCERLPAGGSFILPMPAVALDEDQVEDRESPWTVRALSDGEMHFESLNRRDADWIVSARRRTAVPVVPLRRA
jgi:hypothetical protein